MGSGPSACEASAWPGRQARMQGLSHAVWGLGCSRGKGRGRRAWRMETLVVLQFLTPCGLVPAHCATQEEEEEGATLTGAGASGLAGSCGDHLGLVAEGHASGPFTGRVWVGGPGAWEWPYSRGACRSCAARVHMVHVHACMACMGASMPQGPHMPLRGGSAPGARPFSSQAAHAHAHAGV